MKIIIATTSFLSYKLIQGQISYLTSQGHDVIFISSYNSKVHLKVKEEGGRFIAVDFEREISVFKDLLSVIKIFKIIRHEKPDIINYSTPKASLLFSLVSVFFFKTIFVFTLRGLRSDTLGGMKKHIVFFTEKLCCKLADKVIAISPSLLDHAIGLGLLKENKAVVFGKGSSNGVDVNKFKRTSEVIEKGKKLKLELNIPSDSIIFGFVGRLVKDKGIEELVNAFQLINEEFPNTYLILTGSFEEGDYIGDQLIDLISVHSNIRHVNFTSDVPTVMSIYNILVLYSYREGFGNVAIEASSMGIPVLVSNIPGAKDTIENNITGLLVEPCNVNELYKQMRYYLLNQDLIKVHGVNGRKRVEKYFKSEFIWKSQLDLYTSF